MPPWHLSRQKELQSTVGEALIRGARNVVTGISENSFPQFSSIPRSNISCSRHYLETSASISRETIDQRKSLSFLGRFTRIVLFSPASSISCQFYHYHSKNSRLEMNRISFHNTSQEKLMATSSYLSQIAIRQVRCPTLNELQLHKFPVPAYVTVKTKFPNCHWRVNGSLKDRHSYGNNMLYRFFWSNTIGMGSHSNPSLEMGIENCHSSASSCSSGASSDGPIDGSDTQEQPDSSTIPSDWNLPGERKLKLLSGSCYLPHPDKEETGGEDAHFICVDEQAIGVADGVGGWADLGVDAGQYARELMFHSVAAIEQEPKGSIDPSRVLEKAYLCTKVRGSSTACIIALTDQEKEEKLYKGIHAVNLGDSGFAVIRDGCTVFRSPVQQHDFNFTYQLECGQCSDLPSSAQVFAFPVASGDVIVAGTDGLFDNLYNNEIAKVVVQAVRASLGPQVTAQKIAALARQRALDNIRQTPFSTAAQDAGYRYYGGKLDDITVVVSYITVSDD